MPTTLVLIDAPLPPNVIHSGSFPNRTRRFGHPWADAVWAAIQRGARLPEEVEWLTQHAQVMEPPETPGRHPIHSTN